MSPLQQFIEAWHESARDVTSLLKGLEPEAWHRPTDCPGWSVHDVVAHLAAIEHEMATGEGPATVPHGTREVPSAYTEAGVAERRDHSPEQLIHELETAVGERHQQLVDLAPTDPKGLPDHTPGGIGWDWQTLLRNRAVDVWVHEQDIRRATGRTGGMDTEGADIVAAVFAAALPYVIGKRVAPPAGTTVAVQVDDRVTAYTVDESGRCVPSDGVEEPTVSLRMDRETLTVLGAGRRDAGSRQVAVEGDTRLGELILQSLAVTP